MAASSLPPIGLWAGPLRTVPMDAARDIAGEIEEMGYGVMWFSESSRDPFVNLAVLLGCTERIIGGTAVASFWGRDPLGMATAAKAMTEAFPGRFLLGLGVSHKPLVEGQRGHRYEKPLSTVKSYLDQMDAAPYNSVEPPVPVRRLLAALGPKMLQLAAERSNGVIPYLAPPEHTALSRAALGAGSLVCPIQAMTLETDPSRAREIARKAHLAFYMNLPNYTNNLKRLGFADEDFEGGGSDRLVDALVAWGPTDTIVERVRAHFDAGANHVGVQVIAEDPSPPVSAWKEMADALAGVGPAQPAGC